MVKNLNSSDPIFNEEHEVKTSAIKWGKIGDWIKGTLVDNTREVKSTLSSKGEMQKIFEFKIEGGQFHNIREDRSVDPEPTVLERGSFWSVYAKPALAQQLRNAKLGQVIGLRYAEDRKPSKPGYNPMKIVKVYLGEMDSTYQGEQSIDSFADSLEE